MVLSKLFFSPSLLCFVSRPETLQVFNREKKKRDGTLCIFLQVDGKYLG